jgi:very-short-patch-repair endonuclease
LGAGETEMISGLTRLAKELRKNSTEAESILWNRLRSRQIEGIKFRRQQPIEGYIVDFVSFEKRIIIELDGGQHAKEHEKDRIREGILEENGFRILRFWNNEIFENLDGVLETIRLECLK